MRITAFAVVVFFAACSGRATVDDLSGAGGAQPNASSGGLTTSSSSSGTGGFDACNGPGQCLLAHPGCCHNCDVPSLDWLVPIAKTQTEAFNAQQCPRPEDCPACEASCPNGNLFSFCADGRCRAADMRTLDLSVCTSSAECSLRIGTTCCEPCIEVEPVCSELIALNSAAQAELRALVCPEDGADCPPCAPSYPDDAVAECIDGHCQVSILE